MLCLMKAILLAASILFAQAQVFKANSVTSTRG